MYMVIAVSLLALLAGFALGFCFGMVVTANFYEDESGRKDDTIR